MTLPHHARLLGILEPPQPVGHPTNRDDVRRSVVIDIHRPLAAIRYEFAHDINHSVLMALPLAALRTGILIPVRAAHEVRPAVSIHVDGRDPFGMIGAQSMHEERRVRHISWAIAP